MLLSVVHSLSDLVCRVFKDVDLNHLSASQQSQKKVLVYFHFDK